VYEGAQQAVALLPAQYHPHLAAPPTTQPPSLQDLLQPEPKGSALASPRSSSQSASSGSAGSQSQ
jgi:hypothetical protein